jgi:hypothetical protein
MKRKISIPIFCCLMGVLANACLEPFQAPSSREEVNNLVVDGFLNGTDRRCTIYLSRAEPLEAPHMRIVETGAQVFLKDEIGTSILLGESVAGTYEASDLPFNAGSKIILKITTRDKVEFESKTVTILKTPSIDSVTWATDQTGVPLYIYAHNTSDENGYYFWKYEETWSYTARFETAVTLDNNLNLIPLTENMYQCWNSEKSKDILVASSTVLNDDSGILQKFPLVTVPWESEKLQTRYSVEIEQRAISKETYEYLQELKKNTENLGTLFDPLPSQPVGNLKCLTYPDELVLGNFTASTIEQKRIFISTIGLERPPGKRSVTGNESCALVEIRSRADWELFAPVWNGTVMDPVMGTSPICVDCRIRGGTNIKPDFWQ